MPADFLQLTGKRVLVMGVANRKSVAWHVSRVLVEAGAEVVYAVRTEARATLRAVRKSARHGGASVRTVQRSLHPQRTAKRVLRSAKLLYHRATKAGRLSLKRVRRRVRLFRPA